MAPTTPPFINPSLRTNRGDDGAAGALARATSAEKKEGSRGPKGPKVSNNFGPVPTRRNPARGAKVDGGLAEAEVAGGTPRKKPPGQSPRKKPRGEKTFLLRLDREKGATEQGRKEFIGLVEGRADDGRPKEALPKTTKPPPVTQEDNKDDLDTEEEESNEEASEDASDDAKRPARRNLDRKAKLGSLRTSGPKAAAPRNPSTRSTRTMRSSPVMMRPTSRPTVLTGPPGRRPRGAGRTMSPYELVRRSLGNQEAIPRRTS